MFSNNRRCRPCYKNRRQCRDSAYGSYAAADQGPLPMALDVAQAARQNNNFRIAVWTGVHMQMTLMAIPPCGEVGLELHPDTDQFIRIEQGKALVKMGECKDALNYLQNAGCGDAIFIPAGTWHNIINTGTEPLKLYSVYAPPHHPRGTVQPVKPPSGH